MQKTKYCLDLEGQLVHCEWGMHSVLSPNSNDTLSAFSFLFLSILKKMIPVKYTRVIERDQALCESSLQNKNLGV